MARKNKQGLDYFPHDVGLSGDIKIRMLEAEHGHMGYYVYMKLLENIYTNGYYLDFGERTMKIFANDLKCNKEEFENIIETCMSEGLFNRAMYDAYRILTSLRIQERFYEATVRRGIVEMDSRYLLRSVIIDVTRQNIFIDGVNLSNNTSSTVPKCSSTVPKCSSTVPKYTKKRREEKSKEEKIESISTETVQHTYTKESIPKEERKKARKKNNHIRNTVPPPLEAVQTYFAERKHSNPQEESERFHDYYTMRGWKIRDGLMKDWQAAARNWIKNNYSEKKFSNNHNDNPDLFPTKTEEQKKLEEEERDKMFEFDSYEMNPVTHVEVHGKIPDGYPKHKYELLRKQKPELVDRANAIIDSNKGQANGM